MSQLKTNLVAAVVALLLMSGSAPAQTEPDARQLLKLAGETYQNLKSYHFEATRSKVSASEAMGVKSEQRSEESFALAAVKPDRRRSELKDSTVSFMTASDGRTEWTYLPGLKQYLKKAKGDGQRPVAFTNPTEIFAAAFSDPLSLLALELSMRLTGYEHLADGVKSAQLLREEKIEVAGRSIDCYVVEVDYAPAVQQAGEQLSRKTLWIDQARKVVLREIARSKIPTRFGGFIDSTQTTTFTLARVNEPLADALFAFAPPADAREVEELGLSAKTSAWIGKEAAAFKLKDLDGREVSSQALRGRVVLLDFWATWCAPCLIELPSIEKVHREFKDQGLIVLGVNDEAPETARAFMKEKNYTFTTLVDAGREVAQRYEVEAIPQVLVIGKDGKVASHFFGMKSENVLRSALEKVGLRSDPARAGTTAGRVTPSVPAESPVKPPAGRAPAGESVSASVSLLMPVEGDKNLSHLTGSAAVKSAVNQPQPDYPPLARAARARGQVEVVVMISEEGRVVESLAVSGHPLLRDAARGAANQWVFEPPRRDGARSKSLAVLTFTFTLPE